MIIEINAVNLIGILLCFILSAMFSLIFKKYVFIPLNFDYGKGLEKQSKLINKKENNQSWVFSIGAGIVASLFVIVLLQAIFIIK